MMALQLFRESYTVFPESTTICPKLLQLENALFLILVTEFGMIIEVRPEQELKAYCPMEVTVFGMSIEVRLEQPENVEYSMEVTEFGIFIEVKPEQ